MKPEDRVLFACTRQNFQAKHQQAILEISRDYPLSWELIFWKAERHGVASLVFVNLCQRQVVELNIPASIVDHYRLYTLRNTVRKEQRAQKLGEVLGYFESRSIDAMLIKGGVLDVLVYDHPTYSTLGDIDLVLRSRRDNFSKTELDQMMHDLYESGIEYDFYDHHDVTINGALPIDFDLIWQEVRKLEYRGRPVWVMSGEDMLISLCVNSCRKRYFRLKSLLDIAESISKIDDLRWDIVVEKARLYDCSNIVYTALLVTGLTLGSEIPAGTLENMRIDPIRKALINSLVNYTLRYSSLPTDPISGTILRGRQIHSSLLLPYATYRFYQIRHKIFEEVLQ